MTQDSSQEEPKLIIDEDWKTQVEREKEELKKKQQKSEAAASDTSADGESTQSDQVAGDATEQPLSPPPPASLTLLVTTLATQAMAAMGLMPDDDGKPMPLNLDFARHFIDLISVIEDKTKGNLTDQEKSYIQEALHQLRMTFVAVTKQSNS